MSRRRPTVIDQIMAEPMRLPGCPDLIVTRGFAYTFFVERCGYDPHASGFASVNYLVFGRDVATGGAVGGASLGGDRARQPMNAKIVDALLVVVGLEALAFAVGILVLGWRRRRRRRDVWAARMRRRYPS